MSITPEQLDEIEKLAEAATPGPWDADVGVDFDDGCPIVEWYACGPSQESREFDEDGLPTQGAAKGLAEKDAAFITAMREHALPLVKAVREARAEADVAKAFHDVAAKERDYERVVNNRMRAALDWIANPVAIGSAFHEEAVARARREL